jgi:glycosyltransferase involved in cell wall biosynthesis
MRADRSSPQNPASRRLYGALERGVDIVPFEIKTPRSRLDGATSVTGLSIVIPAWNEEDRLRRTLERYLPQLESRGTPFEIVVVSDGHHDRTAEVARAYAARGVRVLEFSRKLGKGGAVLAGLKETRYDNVGYLDADGPVPPSEILEMDEALGHTDGVVASRWLHASRVLRPEPRFNRVAGRIWNILVRSLLFMPLRDTQCGAKFFRRSVVLPALRAVALTNRAFDVDLLYHLRKSGHAIQEVPVTWAHDEDTRMPIGRAIPVMLISLVAMRVMNTPIGQRVPDRWVQWFLHVWGDS